MYTYINWHLSYISAKYKMFKSRSQPKALIRRRVKLKLFAEFMEAKVGMESVKGVLMEWTAGGAAATPGLRAGI